MHPAAVRASRHSCIMDYGWCVADVPDDACAGVFEAESRKRLKEWG